MLARPQPGSGSRRPALLSVPLCRVSGARVLVVVALLGEQRLSCLIERGGLFGVDRGPAEVELVDDIDDDAADEGPHGRLVVGWYDVPGRPGGRRRGQGLLVGLLVVVEVRPLGDVAR